MKPFHFARALLHSQFELDRFASTLDRLEGYDYPSESANKRIHSLRINLERSKSALEKIEVDYPDDSDGASDRLNSEYRKLISYRNQLEILERAKSDEVPWSLVPSIEKLAEPLLPGRDLVITTTPQMTYMVSWPTDPIDTNITIFLPKLHRANAFLHILIGHELFHPVVTEFIKTERGKIAPAIRDACKKLVPSGLPLFDPARLDQVVGHSLQAWETGLTELMCDMGAASLFGPAALWSLSAFSSTYDQDHEHGNRTAYYPSWRNRLKTVFEFLRDSEDLPGRMVDLVGQLRDAKLLSHAMALEKALTDEASHCVSASLTFADPFVKIAYDQISKSLSAAREEIRLKTEKIDDRWTHVIDQIPHLLGRFSLNVPPSEIIEPGTLESKSASLTAIFMAAWLERLHMESTGNLKLAGYQLLNRLTLKAIEDAEIKKAFQQWRSAQ